MQGWELELGRGGGGGGGANLLAYRRMGSVVATLACRKQTSVPWCGGTRRSPRQADAGVCVGAGVWPLAAAAWGWGSGFAFFCVLHLWLLAAGGLSRVSTLTTATAAPAVRYAARTGPPTSNGLPANLTVTTPPGLHSRPRGTSQPHRARNSQPEREGALRGVQMRRLRGSQQRGNAAATVAPSGGRAYSRTGRNKRSRAGGWGQKPPTHNNDVQYVPSIPPLQPPRGASIGRAPKHIPPPHIPPFPPPPPTHQH